MYCTVQDMQARFEDYELIQLSNPGQADIDTAVIDQAISDASAEIESYLGGRYTLPLNPIPKVLNRISCNMARYYLYDQTTPDHIEKTYQDALRFLRDVASGKVVLGISTEGSEAGATESTAEMQSDTAVWSRTKSGGFI